VSVLNPPLTSTTGFTLGNGTGIAMSGGVASLSGSTDGWYPALFNTPVASDAWFAQCTIASAPTSVPAAVIIRGNVSTWQQVAVGFGSANTYVIFTTSATASGATTEATLAGLFASGDVCRVTAIPILTGGTLYTVYKNGTSIGGWTDSGATSSSGAANRLGGLAMQRSSFTNSCSLSNPIFADLGGLARPNNVPLNRSALY
jgi:hypothetical protein